MIIRALALTLFVSAYLLFWCQPMVAKMMLPLLGGSASVWTTCVLFFQVMLLLGYVYAHLLTRLARLRTQFLIHGTLLLAAIAFLPIAFFGSGLDSSTGASMQQPVMWLLYSLLVTVGFPFFMLSTTAPLLQNWLANTQADSRHDPYFLYAASNAGSLLSLVSYPLLIEPGFGLRDQNRLWSAGYGLLLLLIASAAVLVWKNSRLESVRVVVNGEIAQPSSRTRLFWLTAAFVPSALMLAVTNHISVNLAPVPFLWMIPLAVYLLTYILAFRRGRTISAAQLSKWAPVIFLLLLPLVPDVSPPSAGWNWLLMAAHVGVLFFGAFLCHTALAARRPDTRYLTEFYFWLALGGAAGGAFTAVIAPAIFSTVLEYPLLVAMLPFFREATDGADRHRWSDWTYPSLLGVMFAGSWYGLKVMRIDAGNTWALLPDVLFFIVVFLFRKRALRFALGFAVLLLGYTLIVPEYVESGERLYVARNFFGVKKVLSDVNGNTRRLLHGDTLHGLESTDGLKSGQPLSYYHPTGPIGDVMEVLASRPRQQVGVIGLGTGTMAAYAGPDRQMTFIDLDPQVEVIARGFFTFVRRCGPNCTVVVADGRLAVGQLPNQHFDLLMLDAFSSDSIPAHLVSREALQIYQAKLKPGGLLLFHVSNRYLRVEKLVCAVLTDAGLVGFLRSDRDENISGKSGSDYVIAARDIADLGAIVADPKWQPIPQTCEVTPWTDDYSNMLSLIRWRRAR